MKTVTFKRTQSIEAVKIERFTTRGQIIVHDAKGKEVNLGKTPTALLPLNPGDYVTPDLKQKLTLVDGDGWKESKPVKKTS